ncbi:F-box only protein 7 isoform X2 [Scleropages formosus]|uniref:F-box only protein 7 isoform X2 n=1 Tax=Scleropages formosus TaxID=113540 RepID=UPI0008780E80|nr:F-box only protein 7 isoform X2 [Scleropages formosus]
MRLRVRLHKHTSRLELDGDAPSLTDLAIHVKEIILPSCGLSPETEFSLSLNGNEPLIDSGQSLSSCGIVSGDLICVILAQVDRPAPSVVSSRGSNSDASPTRQCEKQPLAAKHSAEAGASSAHVHVREEDRGPEAEQDSDLGLFSPEPMLCSEAEEGKVPHSLDVLYHRAQSRSPCDSVVVAAHCLMLETGFVPLGSEGRPGEMPPGWREEGGVYRLQYSHVLCEHGLTAIVAVPMGVMLVINAIMKINETVENAQKLLLRPSAYVTERWAGESAAVVYRDLKKLSRIFKDQLVYPLIATARQAMNLPAAFGPTALPPELLLRVLRLLDVASVVALSAVNHELHVAAADPSLWRHLYHRDFRGKDLAETCSFRAARRRARFQQPTKRH